MRVRIERLGRFGNCYVDVWHAGVWHAWNDEPISRRQARRLADFLRTQR